MWPRKGRHALRPRGLRRAINSNGHRIKHKEMKKKVSTRTTQIPVGEGNDAAINSSSSHYHNLEERLTDTMIYLLHKRGMHSSI